MRATLLHRHHAKRICNTRGNLYNKELMRKSMDATVAIEPNGTVASFLTNELILVAERIYQSRRRYLCFKRYSISLLGKPFSLAKVVKIIKGLQTFYPHFTGIKMQHINICITSYGKQNGSCTVLLIVKGC